MTRRIDVQVHWRNFALLALAALAWAVGSHWLIVQSGVAPATRAWHMLHAAAGAVVTLMVAVALPATIRGGVALRPLGWRLRVAGVLMALQFCANYALTTRGT